MDAPGQMQRKQTMNSTLGTIAATLILLAGFVFGSGSAFAAGNADAEPAADLRSETRAQAEDAARTAANDAVVRMRAATRLDLAVELPGRTVAQTAGD